MHRIRKLSSSITDLLSSKRKECDGPFNESLAGSRNPLHLAVALSNEQRAQQLIDDAVCDVDDEDEQGRIPLQVSVLGQNVQLTRLLIERGSCVDHADFNQTSAAHLAAKYNQTDQFRVLLDAGADFIMEDKYGRTAFDIACEDGRVEMVAELIEYGALTELMKRHNTSVQPRISPLHLAARNGHVEICFHLLRNGVDLNQRTANGSALHEAVHHEQIQLGINHNIADRDGRTAKDVAKESAGRSTTAALISSLLEQYPLRIYGVAVRDFEDRHNPSSLRLRQRETVWVIDQSDHRFWKGVVFERFGRSRSGLFPPELVDIVEVCQTVLEMKNVLQKPPDKMGGGSNGSKLTLRRIKRVDVPLVPDVPGMAEFGHRTRTLSGGSRRSMSSLHDMCAASTSSQFNGSPSSSRAPSSCADTYDLASPTFDAGTLGRQSGMHSQRSLGTFNTLHLSKPVSNASKDSSRHSTASSGSSGFESVKTGNQLASSHSTSSFGSGSQGYPLNTKLSIGSHDDTTMLPLTVPKLDINDMLMKGIPDSEIIGEWLEKLGMQAYLPLFITQGFDVASLSKLTTEDLTSLGIRDANQRKQLHADIQTWNVTDDWPETTHPQESCGLWLTALGLQQYVRVFNNEGLTTMQQIYNLSFEDLEDIGIKKLGHIKRICLALKKLKNFRRFVSSRPPSENHHSPDSGIGDPYSTLRKKSVPSRMGMFPSSSLVHDELPSPPPPAAKGGRLHIVTNQEILSAAPLPPRLLSGEILRMERHDVGYASQSPPSPAPVPLYQPPLLPGRGLAQAAAPAGRALAHLAGSSTFRSTPTTPSRSVSGSTAATTRFMFADEPHHRRHSRPEMFVDEQQQQRLGRELSALAMSAE